MEVQKDFKELLALFNAHHVKYLIVGGYALALHGAPRYTGDLDIFYIGREQLILNKKSTARKKDLADLEALGED